MTVAIGIIGTGVMGSDHAAILHRYVSGARPAMVADLDPVRAAAVAESLGCPATDDPAALIRSADVDAVLVASPDATHPEYVRACVAAGKPVLCEKPLAPTLAESAALIRDLGAGADLVALGFMRRFDPGYAELRRAVRSGDIGTPVLAHTSARTVTAGPGSTAESGISNSAVHDFDIVPWLLGAPVTEVSRESTRPSGRAGFPDPQVILLRTADGVLTTVELFLTAGYGYDIRCEIVGESGAISLAEPVRAIVDTTLRRSAGYPPDWRPRFADAYRLELQAWVDSLGGAPAAPLATARDGLVASAVAAAAVASMHAGGGWTAVEVP